MISKRAKNDTRWNVEDGSLRRTYINAVLNHVQFAPTAPPRLATSGFGLSGTVWDVTTGAPLPVLPEETRVTRMDFSPDGALLAVFTAGEGNDLEIRTAAGQLLQKFSLLHRTNPVSEIVWVTPDLLVTNDEGGLVIATKREGSNEFAPSTAWRVPGYSDGLAVSPDGKTLAVGVSPGGELNGFTFLPL